MSNSLFDTAREGFLKGQIGWTGSTIKVALVRGYTYVATHSVVSDVTGAGGTLHATSPAFTTKTTNSPLGGVCDADDVSTWTGAVTGGNPNANGSNHSLLIFQSSAFGAGDSAADAAASAQRLIAWIDTGAAFPIIPNGAALTLQWAADGNRIFHL